MQILTQKLYYISLKKSINDYISYNSSFELLLSKRVLFGKSIKLLDYGGV